MKAFMVELKVKPECADEFLAVSKANAEGSHGEAGNIRFDLLQKDGTDTFILYEIWKDDEAVALHKETSHYKNWASAMDKVLAAPRAKTVFIPAALS